MKTILTPLDGSPLAEQVLPFVGLLAPIVGARVLLLRGITEAEHEVLFADASASPAASDELVLRPSVCAHCSVASQCRQTDCYLASQAELLRGAGVESYADTRAGAPAEVIASTAAGWPDTLIAMATHGRGGLRRWALGSVADQVLHASTLPLLLVRGAEAGRTPRPVPLLRRILVPLDGSALAQQALPLALELAVRAQAELLLLQVVAASMDEFLRTVPVADDVRGALYDQALQAFGALGSELPQQQVQLATAVALGPTAQAIALEASRRNVDLIVMATHGYSGLQRWRLGSVADSLLQTSTTPLLLVRAQELVDEGSDTKSG
jgi:nucleotide-binding universal stress UspA family protein